MKRNHLFVSVCLCFLSVDKLMAQVYNSINISTGYDKNSGTYLSPPQREQNWKLTAVPSNDNLSVPYAPWVVPPFTPYWSFFPEAQWISRTQTSAIVASNPPNAGLGAYTFTYCFCTCSRDTVRIKYELLADDQVRAYLDGTILLANGTQNGSTHYHFPNQLTVDTLVVLDFGNHCLSVNVYDVGGAVLGLALQGVISEINCVAGEKILGDTLICANVSGGTYSLNANSPNATYDWTVSGGDITSGQSTGSIQVNWTSAVNRQIRVTPLSNDGCRGISSVLNIKVIPDPPPLTISGDTILCEYSKGEKYLATVIPGVTYNWTITGGMNMSGNHTNPVTVDWGGGGTGKLSVFAITKEGCIGPPATLDVKIDHPETDSLYGSPSVCPNIKGVNYYVIPSEPGSTFLWSVSGGTQSGGGSSDTIKVDWGGPGTGKVKLVEITALGCIGDTLEMDVVKNHLLKANIPKGDTVVCEYTSNVPYAAIHTNQSAYTWEVIGGVITGGDGNSSVMISWGAEGIGRITLYETSFDSVSNLPCTSPASVLNVRIAGVPAASVIQGDFDICANAATQTYKVDGLPGSTYYWNMNGDTDLTGKGTNTVSYTWRNAGSYPVTVFETSIDKCKGALIDTLIQIRPVPATSSISGDSVICFPDFSNFTYSVSGLPGSDFLWMVDEGDKISEDTSTITVNWNGNNGRIRVLEVSAFGCIGDTVYMNLYVNKPSVELLVVSDSTERENIILVEWKLHNDPQYKNPFEIYRRGAFRGSEWKQIATVSSVPGKTAYRYDDKTVRTNDSVYEYRVRGFDYCGKPIESQPHINILLKGEKSLGYNVGLDWNNYFGWQNGVSEYELWRKAGDESTYRLFNSMGNDTAVTYESIFDAFKLCYRIRAVENGGNNRESWSNEVCFEFDPVLWIPNAFTPNDDNLNDVFLLKGIGIKNFQILIYDRWGEKLFTSNSLDHPWDGTFKGKPCQEGAYIYLVKYSGYRDNLIQQNGSVILLR